MPPKDGKRLGEQVRGLSSQGGIEEDEMSAEEWEVVCPFLFIIVEIHLDPDAIPLLTLHRS